MRVRPGRHIQRAFPLKTGRDGLDEQLTAVQRSLDVFHVWPSGCPSLPLVTVAKRASRSGAPSHSDCLIPQSPLSLAPTPPSTKETAKKDCEGGTWRETPVPAPTRSGKAFGFMLCAYVFVLFLHDSDPVKSCHFYFTVLSRSLFLTIPSFITLQS